SCQYLSYTDVLFPCIIRRPLTSTLFPYTTLFRSRLSNLLLADQDDMVQKGLGWLLRETAKADSKRTVPYLIKIRSRAPRLVLRTDRKSTRLNSSHGSISYAVFCLKKKI